MPEPRVDLAARRVTASVRDIATAKQVDVPRPGGPLALARTELGQRVHGRYRTEREANVEGFRAEVGVSLSVTVDDFEATIRGRADGVIEEEGGRLLVEEVKSVDQPTSRLADLHVRDLADAARQARLYALALARAGPDRTVAARLVLVSLVDGGTREIPVSFERDRALRELERILRRWIREAKEEAEAAATRADAAARLVFPFEEMRPGQERLVQDLESSLEAGRPALVVAPTGIGKTVGALLPALRFALRRNARLFFLTTRTTQQVMVAETFERVREAAGEAGDGLRAVSLRAKAGMCPPGSLLCHPEHCAYLERFLEERKRERVLDALLEEHRHLAPDTVYAAGEEHVVCPYGLGLALVLRADVVIADLNYVYDPGVALEPLFDATSPRPAVVVVDEAHNLFDRAREYRSPFVRRADVDRLRAQVESGELRASTDAPDDTTLPGLGGAPAVDDVFPALTDLLDRLDRTLAETLARARADPASGAVEDSRVVPFDPTGWGELGADAARTLVRYAHYTLAHGLVRRDDPVVGMLQLVMAMHALHETERPELVPYVAGENGPEGEGAGVLCVDPAPWLAQRHGQVAGTIAMSATLEPLDYYVDVLGFAEHHPERLTLPSPFPSEHRLVRVVPTISTTWRERRRHLDAIAQAIREAIAVEPGRYVAYFPSFRFLEDVRARLALPDDALLVQQPRMGGRARTTMLERLRTSSEPKLLLAVMGGIFAEGIDLPGEQLIGALVVGPALPQVGFERAVMQHHFDERYQSGFAYAMLFPGMQRVIQAAGRVHRRPDDKGVILLLGRRFTRSPYVDCLPSHWVRYGDPREIVTQDPLPDLESFWQGRAAMSP